MLDRQRVLIPASHFYEWQARPGASRQPMLIAPERGDGLVFAGRLGRWKDEASGEMLPAVTILTTAPNPLLSRVHNRMPVILPSSSWSRWLDPQNTAKDVEELLKPCPDDWLTLRRAATGYRSHLSLWLSGYGPFQALAGAGA